MGFSPDIENLLKIGTGIFWSLAYFIIIWRGFKDRTYGMPMVALASNISWEFIFSFVYPHDPPQLYINIPWFFLDLVIVSQFLYFGPRVFAPPIRKSLLYVFFALSVWVSVLLISWLTVQFNNWTGSYAAFSSNLMMSILFVVMLRTRNDLSGQSIYVAIFKMVGTILPSILFFARNPSSLLMNSLYIFIFVFDVLYFIMLYAKHKELGIEPWRRV